MTLVLSVGYAIESPSFSPKSLYMPDNWTRPLARDRRAPNGFIEPCQPTLWPAAPPGDQWVHEIKHDGFRMIGHREQGRVRIWSRNGNDWTHSLSLIRDAVLSHGALQLGEPDAPADSVEMGRSRPEAANIFLQLCNLVLLISWLLSAPVSVISRGCAHRVETMPSR
jgi:hypothetical protein